MSTESEDQQQISPQQTAIDSFSDLTLEFVDALCGVWDDDTVLQKTKLKIQMGIGDLNMTGDAPENRVALIESWQKSLEPHYDACQRKDPAVFGKIEMQNESLRELRISEKYNDEGIDEDTRDCIWEYVLGLNKFAQMYSLYSNIPGGMMTTLTDMASKISDDIQSGKGSLADIDVVSLGQSVAQNIDPKELEAFSQNVMSNLGSVQSLCSSVMGAGGVGGGGNAQPGQNQTPNPMMNLGGLSSVMGMLGKMM